MLRMFSESVGASDGSLPSMWCERQQTPRDSLSSYVSDAEQQDSLTALADRRCRVFDLDAFYFNRYLILVIVDQ